MDYATYRRSYFVDPPLGAVIVITSPLAQE